MLDPTDAVNQAQSTHEGIALECEVTRFDSEMLELSYRVLNDSGDSIFLLTPLTELGDEGLVEVPDKVYATIEPDGALRLAKQAWPVPDDVDVYLPEVPHLTEVPSGHYFEETVRSPLPVRISYPYRESDPVQPQRAPVPVPSEATSLVLWIAYIADEYAARSMRPDDADRGTTSDSSYDELCGHQSILHRELTDVRIPVQCIETGTARRTT
jgi:hypothetical protein